MQRGWGSEGRKEKLEEGASLPVARWIQSQSTRISGSWSQQLPAGLSQPPHPWRGATPWGLWEPKPKHSSLPIAQDNGYPLSSSLPREGAGGFGQIGFWVEVCVEARDPSSRGLPLPLSPLPYSHPNQTLEWGWGLEVEQSLTHKPVTRRGLERTLQLRPVLPPPEEQQRNLQPHFGRRQTAARVSWRFPLLEPAEAALRWCGRGDLVPMAAHRSRPLPRG